MKNILFFLTLVLILPGCEQTDVRLAAEAGLDAVKAVTLSEQEVQELARIAAREVDSRHRLAPPDSGYARRLRTVVHDLGQRDGYTFGYGVYLAPEVNAFAMADGSIRLYSGLMDLLDDNELRFVLGHEMGHVVQEHLHQKIRLAYAASALRKGMASQENIVGDLARSSLGGFAERLLNAQFSQQEERAADDYGLTFLQNQGHPPEAAASALRKLAGLEQGHSFLSSHPAPKERAERLGSRLASPEPAGSEKGGWIITFEEAQQTAIGWLQRLWGQVQEIFSQVRLPVFS